MNEIEARAAVVAEARTWIGTSWFHQGRTKGGGVDCAMLLAEVYEAVGLIKHIPTPQYPRDFMAHSAGDRFVKMILTHAHEIEGPPLPGDVVVWMVGRCFSHAAIVTAWPNAIHAWYTAKVQELDCEQPGPLTHQHGKPRPRKFFSLF